VLIKILLMLAIAGTALALLQGRRGARRQAIRRLLLLAFTGATCLSVLFPEAWTALAQALGVGRGTDLLLYALIVAFLGFIATSYRRSRDMQRQITLLSRRLALDEAPPARPAAPAIAAASPVDDIAAIAELVRVRPRPAVDDVVPGLRLVHPQQGR
jgi:hypothetical protein